MSSTPIYPKLWSRQGTKEPAARVGPPQQQPQASECGCGGVFYYSSPVLPVPAVS